MGKYDDDIGEDTRQVKKEGKKNSRQLGRDDPKNRKTLGFNVKNEVFREFEMVAACLGTTKIAIFEEMWKDFKAKHEDELTIFKKPE